MAAAEKEILLVSHDWSLSGAPLLLVQVAHLCATRHPTWRVSVVSASPKSTREQYDRLLARLQPSAASVVHWLPSLLLDSSVLAPYGCIILNTCLLQAVGREIVRIMGTVWTSSRLVWWIHEHLPFYIRRAETEWVQNAVRGILFDSEANRSAWLLHHRTLSTVPATAVWLSVVDASLPPAIPDRSSHPDVCFLSVGTIARHKGQNALMRAFLHLSLDWNVRLVLVGFEGDTVQEEKNHYAKSLRTTWAQLPAKVRARIQLVCKTPHVGPYYASADVFVHNASAPGECFGLVYLEAMAAGLPVLSSDAGSAREIVLDQETGRLYPPDDERALVAALARTYLDGPSWRTSAGAAGRRRVLEHFTEQHMMDRWECAV